MANLQKVARSGKAKDSESLSYKAAEILRKAEEEGVTKNFLFTTTFNRLRVQIEDMEALENAAKEEGPLVTKEYVKGRKNLVVNPAITEYNRTATAANGTVATLLNIMKNLPKEEGEQKSKLEELLEA